MTQYLIGIFLGVFAGCSAFMGQILQKKAINKVKATTDNVNIVSLIKSPLWVVGFCMTLAISSVLMALAQIFIGPALIPGLVASGLVVLAIGSVKILKEELNLLDYIILALLIISIVLVSLSQLSIPLDRQRFFDRGFVMRLFVVSALIFAIGIGFFVIGKKTGKKTVFMSMSAGLSYGLSTIWLGIFMNAIGTIFDGPVEATIIAFIVGSVVILIGINIVAILQSNQSLASGNASIVLPFQQLSQQILPIITYFLIFALPIPNWGSVVFMLSGIVVIIIAAFLLSIRQSHLEKLSIDILDTQTQQQCDII